MRRCRTLSWSVIHTLATLLESTGCVPINAPLGVKSSPLEDQKNALPVKVKMQLFSVEHQGIQSLKVHGASFSTPEIVNQREAANINIIRHKEFNLQSLGTGVVQNLLISFKGYLLPVFFLPM
ncbi:hypothetical protein MKX03_020940 [Papaver bracteatum]|nr:hypothetical protein MKX03_020940 [Papaver bracteatum]